MHLKDEKLNARVKSCLTLCQSDGEYLFYLEKRSHCFLLVRSFPTFFIFNFSGPPKETLFLLVAVNPSSSEFYGKNLFIP